MAAQLTLSSALRPSSETITHVTVARPRLVGCCHHHHRVRSRGRGKPWQNEGLSCPWRPPATQHTRAWWARRQASRKARVRCFGRANRPSSVHAVMRRQPLGGGAPNCPPQLPDLQCAWLLLLFCAAPRSQPVPPAAIAEYSRAHADEVWRTLQDMLGGQTADAEPAQRQAPDIAFLPAGPGPGPHACGTPFPAGFSGSMGGCTACAATIVPRGGWA